ncbi:MAG: dihydroorotase [Gammaproteobacteria bacterium]|nr:dihydroorotase [Gammaproteobacteria bacterium]MYF30835.1 dihydroorotase [Gammaproteobacteria bacterium]MYK48478.1 dihydroorotase [Gammaproteobacteria bacterium]
MTSWILRNAVVVNEGRMIEADVAIHDGRIERIGSGTAKPGARDIDLGGAWLLPGMIDDQVHFREPGFEHKANIATESRAAVAGGTTSYLEMPNCVPQTVTPEALLDKHTRAAGRSLANFGFYFGATNDNLDAIKAVDVTKACGVKVFMGASTGNMLVDDPDTLEGIFASCPLLIATHCEDTPTILANEAAARTEFGDAVPIEKHPEIRSEEACYKSSSFAVGLAKRHGSRLHVLHLTTAREMDLFEPGPISEKRITAEACVHHLFFNDSWYAPLGNDLKCNPAVKTRADQLALRHAVVEDRIDVIATDHAPHTREEKDLPYVDAPAGLPLVQHALLSLVEHVKAGEFTIEQVVQKTAHAPATLFEVAERGYVREGYWADLVVIDPDAHTVVDDEPVHAKCGWTPFRGFTFRSRITHTFVNGNLAFADGALQDVPMGKSLEYARS